MLRVRDTIDREYAEPLSVGALAARVRLSPDHLIRSFRAVFGETPHRYLQRRRVERAMSLLRNTTTEVTDIALSVGFTSLGTFGRTFQRIVGETPSEHRLRGPVESAPGCFTMAWTRPSTHVKMPVSEKRTPEPGA